MNAVAVGRRSYDHRLRAIVNEGGDASLFADLEIPRSTLASWMSRGPIEVVTLDVGEEKTDLQAEVLKLRRRVRVLAAVVGLLKSVIRVSGLPGAKCESFRACRNCERLNAECPRTQLGAFSRIPASLPTSARSRPNAE